MQRKQVLEGQSRWPSCVVIFKLKSSDVCSLLRLRRPCDSSCEALFPQACFTGYPHLVATQITNTT